MPMPTIDQIRKLAHTLSFGADASRAAVLLRLGDGPCNVTELCEETGQAQPATSHHLTLLRAAGVVTAARDGHHVVYELTERGESLRAAIEGLVGV